MSAVQKSVADVERLLQECPSWRPVPGGYIALHTRVVSNVRFPDDVFISSAELARVDPRLPCALLALSEHNTLTCGTSLVGRLLIGMTRHFWDGPVKTPDTSGCQHHVYQWLDLSYEPGMPVAKVHTTCYQPEVHHDAVLGDISIVAQHEGRVLDIPVSWLDHRYPGWQGRLLVGQGLGYRGDALVDYVQTAFSQEVTVSLPELPQL